MHIIPVVRKTKFHIWRSRASFFYLVEHAEQLPASGTEPYQDMDVLLVIRIYQYCAFFLLDILSVRCMCSFCTVRQCVILTKLANWFPKHSFKFWTVPLFSCLRWELCGRGFNIWSQVTLLHSESDAVL